MDIIFFTGVGFFLLGIGIVAYLCIKKYPTLILLDPETRQALQEKRLRDRIMEDRLRRHLERFGAVLLHILFIPWRAIRDAFRRFAGKIVATERRYRREQGREQGLSLQDIQRMLHEAERVLREKDFHAAEERLVDLVSAAPKCAAAYALLAKVYEERKEWKEASESLAYAVKLEPLDGEYRFALAKLFVHMQRFDEAFNLFLETVRTHPKNPKYLDAALEQAIASGKWQDAQELFVALREVNPENAKLTVFADALEGAVVNFGERNGVDAGISSEPPKPRGRPRTKKDA